MDNADKPDGAGTDIVSAAALGLAQKPKKKVPVSVSKLTPDVQDAVLAHIMRGSYIETACGAVGIARGTLYEWLRKGTLGQEPYKSFQIAMHAARDACEAEALDCILGAAKRDWKAAAWFLEKTFGRKYAGISVSENLNVEVNTEEARKAKALLVQEAYGFTPEGSKEGGGSEASQEDDGQHAARALPAKVHPR